MREKTLLVFLITLIIANKTLAQRPDTPIYQERFRPQLHFSPQQHWMNDPNGMVYFDHTYHLFFQYYPGGNVWGPMHWGHATSKDLVHWKELPIALYPDSLGYIFSGSEVVDSNNTSGFGKNGKIPLVAIFTQHDQKAADAGKNIFQNQSLAYSLDDGETWTKYSGNPVIKNPGITDFRDPKVMWYAAGKKWLMTLATKDHITFYSSPDLKNWQKESEFGKETGAHGGVWECPDLFPLKLDGKVYWVLIVNIGSGGPNGGSATQYFIGQFNGNKFTPVDTKVRWLDYGPDEYAGITWSNTGNRRIFLGWMSNWQYATQVPTTTWRSAMTIPRELKLFRYNDEMLISSFPVAENSRLTQKTYSYSNVTIRKDHPFKGLNGKLLGQYKVSLEATQLKDFSLELFNAKNEKVIIGYDKSNNQYYVDRRNSGITNFNKDFAGIHAAPRLSGNKTLKLTIIVDKASVEVFADDGATVMTDIFFPTAPLNQLIIKAAEGIKLKSISGLQLSSIW